MMLTIDLTATFCSPEVVWAKRTTYVPALSEIGRAERKSRHEEQISLYTSDFRPNTSLPVASELTISRAQHCL
jgi:hypothetical protein